MAGSANQGLSYSALGSILMFPIKLIVCLAALACGESEAAGRVWQNRLPDKDEVEDE